MKRDSDDELSEEEEKEEKKEEKKGSSQGEEFKKQMNDFFFDPEKKPKWENVGLLAFLTGAFGYYMATRGTPSEEITYIDFINSYLGQGQCTMITISEDKSSDMFKYRAQIDTLDGARVHLVLPQVENFLYKLDQAQREMGKSPQEFVPVKYASEASQTSNQALNWLIGASFVLLLLQLYRSKHTKGPTGTGGSAGQKPGARGGMNDMFNMGKSNVQVYGVDKKIKTRFKHVAGMDQAKVEVMEFVDFLKNPEKYKKLGAKIPRGALLVGPPGTGKTMLAKAVAGEAGVPFMSISGSDFVEMFVGVGASRVRDLFKKAKEKSPSIIFIDEIDAVAKKRHGKFGGNDERDNTLNQLLVEMDGFTTEENVIILAATNRADILDDALKRPGRFDRQIEVTLPNIDERQAIYKVHLKKIKLNAEKTRAEYAKKLATLTPGFSGADISNVCNEGAIIAARQDKTSVGTRQFDEATERVIGGIERKNLMSHEERKRVAYHEAGHAVAGWFLPNSDPLLKVTIIPRSKGALGFAQYLPAEVALKNKEELLDMVKTALGGRIAEDIFYDSVTTGASDDINKVTQIVNGLVQTYGMTQSIGLVGYGSMEGDGFSKPYSDETNWQIDEEIRSIVKEQYKLTKELLMEKKDMIQQLGDLLLEKETINLPDIISVLGERPYGMSESAQDYLTEMKEDIENEAKAQAEEEKEDEELEETLAEEVKDQEKNEDKK